MGFPSGVGKLMSQPKRYASHAARQASFDLGLPHDCVVVECLLHGLLTYARVLGFGIRMARTQQLPSIALLRLAPRLREVACQDSVALDWHATSGRDRTSVARESAQQTGVPIAEGPNPSSSGQSVPVLGSRFDFQAAPAQRSPQAVLCRDPFPTSEVHRGA